MDFLFRFVTAERAENEAEGLESQRMWFKMSGLHIGSRYKKKGSPGVQKNEHRKRTFLLRASAVSDVGSDTFGHFGPEFYLPSEEKTEQGSDG